MKIRETQVGQAADITLLVKSAEIKMTRANKPYLFTVLTDGTDDIQGQDWDFGNGTPPAKNSVLDVYGEISEYMGKKQIKIKTFSYSEQGVEAFAPSGDVDVNAYVNKASELMSSISNESVRELVTQVFRDFTHEWKTTAAAKGVHHAFVAGLLKHTVDVASKAKAIALLTPNCSVDLVIAGALLHDFGKIWTYTLNGALIEMTDEGQMLEHLVLGIVKFEKYRTPENTKIVDLIQHIMSSHHGELEYGSPTTPRFMEAVIVNYADGVDAKCQTILEYNAKVQPGTKFTDKIYTLGNRQLFTQEYVAGVMNG